MKKTSKFISTVKKMFKTLPSDRVPLLAFILSIITLSFSTCQFIISQNRQIRHDKLAVRPILIFEYHIRPFDPFVGFVVKNKGVGPAIIGNLEIRYNDSIVKSWNDINNIINSEKMKISGDAFMEHFHFGGNYVLAPNDEVKIFYKDTAKANINYGNLYYVLSKIRLRLYYKNIYNDECGPAPQDPESLQPD